jgi:hypothetical protein
MRLAPIRPLSLPSGLIGICFVAKMEDRRRVVTLRLAQMLKIDLARFWLRVLRQAVGKYRIALLAKELGVSRVRNQ